MKSKNLSIFIIFVFCFLVVMFCQPAGEVMPREEFKDALHVHPDVGALFTSEAEKNLKKDIMDDFRTKLEDLFNAGDFDGMDDLLAKKHVILEDTTEDYGRVKSSYQYKRLFKQAKDKKQAENPNKTIVLKILITHISVDKLLEPKYIEGNTPEEREVDMIARFSFTYHVLPEDGSFAENQGGGGSGESLHRKVCTWI